MFHFKQFEAARQVREHVVKVALPWAFLTIARKRPLIGQKNTGIRSHEFGPFKYCVAIGIANRPIIIKLIAEVIADPCLLPRVLLKVTEEAFRLRGSGPLIFGSTVPKAGTPLYRGIHRLK